MRHGSRIPFVIAATLGLAAVVLLCYRPGRVGAGEPRGVAVVPRRETPAPATVARVSEVAVEPAPRQEARVEVEPTEEAASIAGRAVWSSSGAPAEGVALFLDRQVTASADVHTGPDGRFRLADVRPGVHTVRLLAPDGRPETRTVKVAQGQALDVGDVTVAARRATPGTLGAGFSEERGGVAVAWLTPEGPAARAGMRVGDKLLSVDGVAVRNRQEAEARTRGTPGTAVRLAVRRDSGEERQVRLTRAD